MKQLGRMLLYFTRRSPSASNVFFTSLAYLLYFKATQVQPKITLLLSFFLSLYSLLVLIFVLINFCTAIYFWTCVICNIMLQMDLQKLLRQFQSETALKKINLIRRKIKFDLNYGLYPTQLFNLFFSILFQFYIYLGWNFFRILLMVYYS